MKMKEEDRKELLLEGHAIQAFISSISCIYLLSCCTHLFLISALCLGLPTFREWRYGIQLEKVLEKGSSHQTGKGLVSASLVLVCAMFTGTKGAGWDNTAAGCIWTLLRRSRVSCYSYKKKRMLSHSLQNWMKEKNIQRQQGEYKNCNYLLFIHVLFGKRKIICCWTWYPLKHWKINQLIYQTN